MTKRIYIGGLPLDFTIDQVPKLLRGITYTKIDIMSNKDGEGRGFMYVDMSENDVNICKNRLNGSRWKGSLIRVENAKMTYLEKARMEKEAVEEKEAKIEEEVVNNFEDKEKWQKVNGLYYPVMKIKDKNYKIIEIIPSHNRYKSKNLDDGTAFRTRDIRKFKWDYIENSSSSDDIQMNDIPQDKKLNAFEQAQLYFEEKRMDQLQYPKEDSFEVVPLDGSKSKKASDGSKSKKVSPVQIDYSIYKTISEKNSNNQSTSKMSENDEDSFEIVNESDSKLKGNERNYNINDEDSFEIVKPQKSQNLINSKQEDIKPKNSKKFK
jgi:hypothetical protein